MKHEYLYVIDKLYFNLLYQYPRTIQGVGIESPGIKSRSAVLPDKPASESDRNESNSISTSSHSDFKS